MSQRSQYTVFNKQNHLKDFKLDVTTNANRLNSTFVVVSETGKNSFLIKCSCCGWLSKAVLIKEQKHGDMGSGSSTCRGEESSEVTQMTCKATQMSLRMSGFCHCWAPPHSEHTESLFLIVSTPKFLQLSLNTLLHPHPHSTRLGVFWISSVDETTLSFHAAKVKNSRIKGGRCIFCPLSHILASCVVPSCSASLQMANTNTHTRFG